MMRVNRAAKLYHHTYHQCKLLPSACMHMCIWSQKFWKPLPVNCNAINCFSLQAYPNISCPPHISTTHIHHTYPPHISTTHIHHTSTTHIYHTCFPWISHIHHTYLPHMSTTHISCPPHTIYQTCLPHIFDIHHTQCNQKKVICCLLKMYWSCFQVKKMLLVIFDWFASPPCFRMILIIFFFIFRIEARKAWLASVSTVFHYTTLYWPNLKRDNCILNKSRKLYIDQISRTLYWPNLKKGNYLKLLTKRNQDVDRSKWCVYL